MKGKKIFALAAFGLFVIFTGLYLVTMCKTVFPYESARSIAVHLGLSPFAPTSHPIWGTFVKAVAGLPGGMVQNIHVATAILSGLTLVLLFFVIIQFDHDRTREERSSDADPNKARLISGIFGAAYLAVSIPFWMMSTRAFPISSGEFLFLLCVLLGILAFRSDRKWLIFPTCFLWGIGLAEFATFIVFSPVFLLYALGFAYVTRRRISFELLLRMFACILLGLSLHFYTAYLAWQHPSARWKNMPEYFANLLHVVKMQKFLIFDVVPKQGWLLLALTAVMPLAVTLSPKTAEKRRGLWSSKVMHGVFFAVGVLMMIDVFISPWSQFKLAPLTVTPSVLVAIWMGYIAGYGYMIFRQVPARENVIFRSIRLFGKVIHIPVLIAVIAGAGWSNLRIVDGAHAEFVDDWAEGLVNSVEDGDLLVSSYAMEDVILLKAHEMERDITVIDPAMSQRGAYRWYLASLFEEPRLKGLAHISLNALLTEWLNMDSENRQRLAVSRLADFWFAAGYKPIPDQWVYRGGDTPSDQELRVLVAEHREMWEELDLGQLQFIKRGASPLAFAAGTYLREISKAANNLGVVCREAGQNDLAATCYTYARQFDPANASALMNLQELGERGLIKNADRINAEYVAFISDLPARLRIWSLGMDYGYIHNADAYLERGISWVISGKPRLAITEIKQAMEIAKDSDRMRLSLAHMYLADQQIGESEQLYVEALEKNPDDLSAMLGLSRIHTLRGEYDVARGYLTRIREGLDEPGSQLMLEEFAVEYMSGQREKAQKILEDIVKAEPNNAKAWTGLAVMAAEDDDQQRFQEIAAKVQNSKYIDNSVRVVFAQMLSSRGDYSRARKLLVQVLSAQPNNVTALEQMLRIHVRERDRAEAERRVEQLLHVEPSSAFGNQVLGSLQYSRRQLLLAEASYRASVQTKRDPDVLNSLAYVLTLMNKHEEAYPLINESVTANSRNPAAWDTMAMVQYGLEKYDVARTSILRALELAPGNQIFMMHHGKILERLGRRDDALKIVRELSLNLEEFPMEARTELIDLQARLRSTE